MSSQSRSLFKEAGYEPLDYYLAGLLAVSVLSLYLRFPTRAYVLEGLARAIPMELGLYSRLLLGNYLLYGLVGDLFYLGLKTIGFSGHAYIALQAMDSLIGASGLFVFFLLLRAIGIDRGYSVIWTFVLGVSLAYWLWSTEAENYILSTFLLQLNFLLLVLDHKTRRISPWFLGGMQAFAIFGHLVNGLFVVVALWFFIATYPGAWRKAFLKYVLACAATAAAGFGGAILVLRFPDWRRALGWVLGSAGGLGGQIHWHGSWWGVRGIRDWLKMTARIFSSLSERAYSHPPAWAASAVLLKAAAILLVLLLVKGVIRRKALWQSHRTVLVACGLWFSCYALVFTSWEPNTMVYRVSDLVPLVTVLALVCQDTLLRGVEQGAALILVLALGVGNFGAEILPRSHWENNPEWVRAQFIKQSTDDSSWIAANGGSGNIYTAYYAERRPLVLENFRGHTEQLRAFLAQIWGAGQKVYVKSLVMDDPYWKAFMRSYSLETHADDHAGTALYLLKPST